MEQSLVVLGVPLDKGVAVDIGVLVGTFVGAQIVGAGVELGTIEGTADAVAVAETDAVAVTTAVAVAVLFEIFGVEVDVGAVVVPEGVLVEVATAVEDAIGVIIITPGVDHPDTPPGDVGSAAPSDTLINPLSSTLELGLHAIIIEIKIGIIRNFKACLLTFIVASFLIFNDTGKKLMKAIGN